MRRTMMAAGFAAAAACAAYGGSLTAVELGEGDTALPSPSRAVLLHAISTNATGTVTLKKVTAFDIAWEETRTVTNIVYTTAWSNLTHAVTNDIVSAWRTNAVGSAVATNFIARAMNAIPPVYPWPDLLFTTNKTVSMETYTNIPYQVESGRTVRNVVQRRRASKYVTNDLASVTLSGGFKTNAVSGVFAPGDFIYATGTAFGCGKVQLIIER